MKRININNIDHLDSPYYKTPDYFNMEETKTRTILSNFETIQQSYDESCGACVVLMVLKYYGIDKYSEKQISKCLHTNSNG